MQVEFHLVRPKENVVSIIIEYVTQLLPQIDTQIGQCWLFYAILIVDISFSDKTIHEEKS